MAKTKKSLKQRLKEKKQEIVSRSEGGNIFRQKDEGTIRVRVLPVGEDNEFVYEIQQIYLNKDLGGSISPATFGEPCALAEKYHELKESGDEEDKELAKKIMPKRKYLMPILMYQDEKGKKVDEKNSNKLLQITSGLYQEIIDFYLDEDEWGDMTDPKNGYDLKITRTGKGQFDTNYSVSPCKNTPIPKEYRKEVDLEKMVRAEADSYEETARKLQEFLGDMSSDDDDDDAPKKSKKKGLKKSSVKDKLAAKKKKKRKKDL